MIGIYKITNPKGRIYIGQSYNIRRRFTDYKRLGCKSQRRLYNSLKKYGVENHVFEIVCECRKDELNELELKYIDIFNCLSRKGLNCYLIGSITHISECTRKKMSKSAKKRAPSFLGKKHTEETKIKLGNIQRGVFPGKRKGIPTSPETKLKLSILKKGKKQSVESIEKRRIAFIKADINCKKVIDTKTGIIHRSIKDASIATGIKLSALRAMLAGQNKNKTNLIYHLNNTVS